MPFQPIPRCHGGPRLRRTVAPGLFEFLDGPPDGDHISYLNALQPEEVCEDILNRGAARTTYALPKMHVRLDTNTVPANVSGGEDRLIQHMVPIVPLDKHRQAGSWWSKWLDPGQTGEKGEEALMMSVIDGHGGVHVCDLVQKFLHPCIAWAISSDPSAVRGEEEAVKRAIRDAYTSVSQDIANAILAAAAHPAEAIGTDLEGMPSVAQLAITHFEKRGGACGVTAVIYQGKLYAAGLGDCRFVTVWEKDGVVSAETMLKDHNVFNPGEVDRVRKAHPDDADVFTTSRNGHHVWLKNGLMPTKCFGEVSFNRTRAQRDLISEQTMTVPIWPKTELDDTPYLGWQPDVAVRDIKGLRFLALAVDGLWDRMTCKEAARGVLAHAEGPQREDVPWDEINQVDVLPTDFPAETDRKGYEDGHWIFQDINPATFLIRNAMCGGDRELLRQMLSLSNGTRKFRDDTTVM